MHIISRKALKDFWEKHPDSETPLKVWFKIVKATKYRSVNHLRETFPTADPVEDKVVFNIGGNKYRLITVIHFKYSKVYIRHVVTHAEYNKGGWKNG